MMTYHTENIDGLAQYCSNSIAKALELLQSCTKPSIKNCLPLMYFVTSVMIPQEISRVMLSRAKIIVKWPQKEYSP